MKEGVCRPDIVSGFFMKKDEFYMTAAVENAKKAKGRTGVNPLVGCVIVKNGRIISEGYHEGPGSVHAEIMAINSSPESLRNSTLYVTLEPCSAWGRTPPCVETIEQIPFKRIVIGSLDPNPRENGRSVKRLRKKFRVDAGIMEDEAKALNPFFGHFIKSKTTYITAKAALTLDGSLTAPDSGSKYFTCAESRRRVHLERYKADAILVGSLTVNADDPILDCRLLKSDYAPVAVILDFSNRLDYSKSIVKDRKRRKMIFVSEKHRKRLKERDDVKYFFVKSREDSWRIIKNDFQKENIISVFVEGGAGVFSGAFESGSVDELQIYYAPRFSPDGNGLRIKGRAGLSLELIEAKKTGRDLFARYRCSQD